MDGRTREERRLSIQKSAVVAAIRLTAPPQIKRRTRHMHRMGLVSLPSLHDRRSASEDALGLVLRLVQLALWTDNNHWHRRMVKTVARDRPKQESLDRAASACSHHQHVWLIQSSLTFVRTTGYIRVRRPWMLDWVSLHYQARQSHGYHMLDGISDVANQVLDNNADLLVGCVLFTNRVHDLGGLRTSCCFLALKRRDFRL